ncbi:hypothetical protein KG088_17600 [Halomonas sp. TRM85114]|uniref:hypothetical protein n=1 Tax=Halomonas jincaotanensis TaxID=2810616 RepID=UPI001BD5757A|nr:hypothetical protein [Halomonas jincaotanensis]MBS9405425.1 hypothetical protein [Halomonas jincaotanensis]
MKKRIVAFHRLNQAQLDQLAVAFHVNYFEALESGDDPAFARPSPRLTAWSVLA